MKTVEFTQSLPTLALLPQSSRVSLRLLRGAAERSEIAWLRKLSASAVEDDLGLQLGPFEAERDELGVVMAFVREGQVIGTIRFVPSGYGLTGGERLIDQIGSTPEYIGLGNWEVGRLVVDPEVRNPELLARCFTLALTELARLRRVNHFYAIATPAMARLWRKFGMQPASPIRGKSGTSYVLVRGSLQSVAASLRLPSMGTATMHAAHRHLAGAALSH